MTHFNNDTLLMILWTLRQSGQSDLIYDQIMTEIINRKRTDRISQWEYVLPIVHNDLSMLAQIDWTIVRALTKPLICVAGN